MILSNNRESKVKDVNYMQEEIKKEMYGYKTKAKKYHVIIV